MPVGLEIYDEKGMLIISTENIIPRFLGTHQIPIKKDGSISIPALQYGGNVTARFFIRKWLSVTGGYLTMLSNEFTTFNTSGTSFNYHVDYDEYKWESGGGSSIITKIENFVTVWAI